MPYNRFSLKSETVVGFARATEMSGAWRL